MANLVKGISNKELLEDAARMYAGNQMWFINKSIEERENGHYGQAKAFNELADKFWKKFELVMEALHGMDEPVRIKMTGLYGFDHCAWFRKLGDCFDFVNDIKFASVMKRSEAEKIIEGSGADWYVKQYNAKAIFVEEVGA